MGVGERCGVVCVCVCVCGAGGHVCGGSGGGVGEKGAMWGCLECQVTFLI